MLAKSQWRCARCGKLLGTYDGARLRIRFARGHEYLVGLPVSGVCRNCGTLNEFTGDRLEDGPEHPATHRRT